MDEYDHNFERDRRRKRLARNRKHKKNQAQRYKRNSEGCKNRYRDNWRDEYDSYYNSDFIDIYNKVCDDSQYEVFYLPVDKEQLKTESCSEEELDVIDNEDE